MKETIPRLMKNVPTKISAPIKTLRQVMANVRSESESNISSLGEIRFQHELSAETLSNHQQPVWRCLRVETAGSRRLPRTRPGRARRRVRVPVPAQVSRSRQQP